jgi:hypothetical protein
MLNPARRDPVNAFGCQVFGQCVGLQVVRRILRGKFIDSVIIQSGLLI